MKRVKTLRTGSVFFLVLLLSIADLMADNSFETQYFKYNDLYQDYYQVINIVNCEISGNDRLTKQKIQKMLPFTVPGKVKLIEILMLENVLLKSGYFEKVAVSLESSSNGLSRTMRIKVWENKILWSIYYRGDYAADLKPLATYLKKNKIKKGKIFNRNNIFNAIQLYKEKLQRSGNFFFYITYHYLIDAQQRLILVINLKKYDDIFVRKLKLSGNKHVTDKAVLNELTFRAGQTVANEKVLAISLWKLRKLGIFKYVFFDITPAGGNEVIVTVKMTEIQSEEINTSISLNSKNRFDFEIDFFDYSVGDKLGRVSCGAVMNFYNETIDLVAMYSLPKLERNYFFNVRFEKDTVNSTYSDKWDQFIEKFNIDITFGRRLSRFLSLHGILNGSRTKIFYATPNGDNSGLPLQLSEDEVFWDQTARFMIMIDTLNDNFFPTRGIRTFLTWTTSLFNENKNFHQLDYKLEFYWPLLNKITFNFYGHSSFLFTKDTLQTLNLEENRKTTAQDYAAIGLTQKKMNLYGIIEFRWRFLKKYAIGAFGEASGAWDSLRNFDIFELAYGIGISFRMAPREHYSAHIIKYPWSINIGFNISDQNDKKPVVSMVSSRDEYYYINLQAAF